MKLKNIIYMGILLLSFITPVSIMADTHELISEEIVEINVVSENEIKSSDHIEYYYRMYNGVLQYRRWNATRGYWIDATWLDVID